MNGVKILSQEIIYNTILPDWGIGLSLFCAIVFIVALIYAYFEKHNILGYICLVVIIASIVVGSIGGSKSKTDISHIEYKVIIDETVSMVEFMDKYEILDQEGEIYTVKERE